MNYNVLVELLFVLLNVISSIETACSGISNKPDITTYYSRDPYPKREIIMQLRRNSGIRKQIRIAKRNLPKITGLRRHKRNTEVNQIFDENIELTANRFLLRFMGFGFSGSPLEEDMGPPMEISQADFDKLKRTHGKDKEGRVIEISENEFNELKRKTGGKKAATQTHFRNVPDSQFPDAISIPANHRTNSRNVPDTQFPGVISIPANHQSNSRNVPDTQFQGVISIPANHQTNSRNVPDTQFPGVISIPSSQQTNSRNEPDTQFPGVISIPSNHQTNSRNVPDTQFPGVISIPSNHQFSSPNEPDTRFSNAISVPANPRTDWQNVPVNKFTGVQHIPMNSKVQKSTDHQNNWQFSPTVSSNNTPNENACTATRRFFTFKDKVAYKGTECWVHNGFKNKKFSFKLCSGSCFSSQSYKCLPAAPRTYNIWFYCTGLWKKWQKYELILPQQCSCIQNNCK